MTNDKVYIVTSGSYSDYHINCVFRTWEEAEAWVAVRWNPGDYNIGEWGFDTPNPGGLVGFRVVMDLDSGDVSWGCEDEHEGPAYYEARYLPPSEYCTFGKQTPSFEVEVMCLARDKEHAVKIASECRRIVLTHPLCEVWRNSPDPSAYEMRSSVQ